MVPPVHALDLSIPLPTQGRKGAATGGAVGAGLVTVMVPPGLVTNGFNALSFNDNDAVFNGRTTETVNESAADKGFFILSR